MDQLKYRYQKPPGRLLTSSMNKKIQKTVQAINKKLDGRKGAIAILVGKNWPELIFPSGSPRTPILMFSKESKKSKFDLNVQTFTDAEKFIMDLTILVSEPLIENNALSPIGLLEQPLSTFQPTTEGPKLEDEFQIYARKLAVTCLICLSLVGDLLAVRFLYKSVIYISQLLT